MALTKCGRCGIAIDNVELPQYVTFDKCRTDIDTEHKTYCLCSMCYIIARYRFSKFIREYKNDKTRTA